ncbi:hypothetical protein Leryth_016784 [Lithospermum erythrorhizon]|nr:hypothetical protein Leryth_016784 [Lithospermum erythrorhizon]
MLLHRRPFWYFIIFFFSPHILEFFPLAKSAPEYTTLVYKGCAHQAISDPTNAYSQALSTLFGNLISQSSKAKFYKTTTGSGQNTVTGLFQCRGDLSNVDCYSCISGLPILIDKLCGKPVAARLQLYGCYMLYEVNGFPQISGMELLYKTCSGKNAGGSEAEQVRDTALNALENGISSANGGFYTTSYQGVYVLGQCEGDIGGSDCGECVKNAVQKAQVECGSSVSGQIYLHKCFITYSNYPHGPPKRSSSSYSDSAPSSSDSSGQSIGKTVAIILGGAASVGFLIILLLFAKNLVKKHDDF